MTDKLTRGALVLLGLIGLEVGLWATLAPRSFYDDFPGGGRTWVAADGPYNEHLLRDLGALNLALAAVVAVALVTRSRPVVLAAGFAWLTYSVPHLVYHVDHAHLLPETSDRVMNTIVLSLTVLLAVAVLGLSYLGPGRRSGSAGSAEPAEPAGSAGTVAASGSADLTRSDEPVRSTRPAGTNPTSTTTDDRRVR